jgi:hypothetical protein
MLVESTALTRIVLAGANVINQSHQNTHQKTSTESTEENTRKERKMSEWTIKTHKKVKIKDPVLIEGMPGIGSVGKITADMLVEQLKAEKLVSFFSHCLPNSVFVKEDNMIDLPKIEIHYARVKKQDFLFLVGDVQPMREKDSYSFADAVLSVAKKYKCKELIALGGIGLSEAPTESRVFCTGNDKRLIEEFVKLGASNKLYGFVGPIMGITGLTLGLGKNYDLKCLALLAETYAAPMHIGLRESKNIIKVLEKRYGFGINLNLVEKDIKRYETELKPVAKQQEMQEQKEVSSDTSYIG